MKLLHNFMIIVASLALASCVSQHSIVKEYNQPLSFFSGKTIIYRNKAEINANHSEIVGYNQWLSDYFQENKRDVYGIQIVNLPNQQLKINYYDNNLLLSGSYIFKNGYQIKGNSLIINKKYRNPCVDTPCIGFGSSSVSMSENEKSDLAVITSYKTSVLHFLLIPTIGEEKYISVFPKIDR